MDREEQVVRPGGVPEAQHECVRRYLEDAGKARPGVCAHLLCDGGERQGINRWRGKLRHVTPRGLRRARPIHPVTEHAIWRDRHDDANEEEIPARLPESPVCRLAA